MWVGAWLQFESGDAFRGQEFPQPVDAEIAAAEHDAHAFARQLVPEFQGRG